MDLLQAIPSVNCIKFVCLSMCVCICIKALEANVQIKTDVQLGFDIIERFVKEILNLRKRKLSQGSNDMRVKVKAKVKVKYKCKFT